MTNMTLAIPEDLHRLMRKHKDIRWSEIARQALRDRAQQLEMLDKLLVRSQLTENDAERMGHAIKSAMARRQMASR